MFESQLMQIPAPGTSSFIGPTPGHLLLCKSPGAVHTFWCKSPGVPGRGMVTDQINTCISAQRSVIGIIKFLTMLEILVTLRTLSVYVKLNNVPKYVFTDFYAKLTSKVTRFAGGS